MCIFTKQSNRMPLGKTEARNAGQKSQNHSLTKHSLKTHRIQFGPVKYKDTKIHVETVLSHVVSCLSCVIVLCEENESSSSEHIYVFNGHDWIQASKNERSVAFNLMVHSKHETVFFNERICTFFAFSLMVIYVFLQYLYKQNEA